MDDRRCTATSKQTGERCRRFPTPGRTVCRFHGGKTPRGVALPQSKGGRYSRDLPTRLAERYAEALRDAVLLELREEIALLDARLADVLGRVDSGESGAAWAALGRLLGAYRRAQAEGRADEAARAVDEIERLIRGGGRDYAAWAEARSLIDQRRRLVESERRRLVEARQMISVEQAMLFVTALAEAARRHVTDPRVLAAMLADIERTLSVADPARRN
jgi:hypothetical protein